MRMAQAALAGAILIATSSSPAQNDAGLTMKQLMLERIHPAANDILLVAFRGSPDADKAWSTVANSAQTLAQAADLLASRNTQTDWRRAAGLLSTAAADAAKAAGAKDAKALSTVAARIDASCTDCHKRYRPNVFPAEAKGIGQ